MTYLDFITQAAIKASVIEAGQTLSPEEQVLIQDSFNDMLDSWNTERLNIYTVEGNSYPLIANKGTYTIGDPADGAVDFGPTRPTMIQNANIIYAGLRFGLDLQSSEQWADIVEQDNVAKIPNKLYWDNAFPISTLALNPIPSVTQATRLELFTWVILSAVTDLTVNVRYPTGYLEPLKLNLAVRLPSQFGLQLDQTMAQIAIDSKARLRQLNATILQGPMDNARAAGQTPTLGLPPAAPPGQ